MYRERQLMKIMEKIFKIVFSCLNTQKSPGQRPKGVLDPQYCIYEPLARYLSSLRYLGSGGSPDRCPEQCFSSGIPS